MSLENGQKPIRNRASPKSRQELDSAYLKNSCKYPFFDYNILMNLNFSGSDFELSSPTHKFKLIFYY